MDLHHGCGKLACLQTTVDRNPLLRQSDYAGVSPQQGGNAVHEIVFYFLFMEVALAESCDSQRAKLWLPDPAGLLADHRVSLFAAKGLGKRFHVGERAVAAKKRERYILRRRSPIAGGAGERRISSMLNGW